MPRVRADLEERLRSVAIVGDAAHRQCATLAVSL
jgi:hypothetical protein